MKYYRYTICLFNSTLGRELTLLEITEIVLQEFIGKFTAEGHRLHQAQRYEGIIKAIVRHWQPERLPDERGGGPAPLSFVDADIKGTLEQIFVDDYLPERTSISSPQTVRQYGRCLKLFGMYLGRPAEPRHLTDRIVGSFLRWLVEVEGVKPVTANGYVKQLKAMWNWLAKKRVVERFPTVEKLKQPDATPVCWTEDELRALFEACGRQEGYILGVPANRWWEAFHLVLWDTGERTGAMRALRWEWLDWRGGYLTVPGEYRKGRQTSMVYSLKPATLEALRLIRTPRCELIFPLKRRSQFYPRYRQLLKDAGLPVVPHKCGPQKIRRSFASYIEAQGGNATKALKHRDRRVTEDSYLDPRITEVESENQKLFRLAE